MKFIVENLLHSLEHTLVLLPFLYLSYLLMEYIEHKGAEKAQRLIARSGKAGPAIGALLGIVPQCGFSAAAAGLYGGKVITFGTLCAIFLSTSDEMLPVMLSNGLPITKILPILGVKVLVALIVGFCADLVISAFFSRPRHESHEHIHEMCKNGHCHCEKNIFLSALTHSLQIFLFIYIATFAINVIIESAGAEQIFGIISGMPFVGEIIAATVGLIPNCASSVVITQLYIDGLIGTGPMLSGLLCGSGVGMLILFRTNRRLKESLAVLAVVFVSSVLFGALFGLIF